MAFLFSQLGVIDPSFTWVCMRSIQKSVRKSVPESFHQGIHKTTRQSIYKSIHYSIPWSIRQSIHRSIHKRIDNRIQESLLHYRVCTKVFRTIFTGAMPEYWQNNSLEHSQGIQSFTRAFTVVFSRRFTRVLVGANLNHLKLTHPCKQNSYQQVTNFKKTHAIHNSKALPKFKTHPRLDMQNRYTKYI